MDRVALFGRLFELVRQSQRENDRFDQAVADYLGVSRAEAHCLDVLEQFGPMTAGRLSELSRLTTGAITKVVDRLENAGYVSRVRDPADRRRVIVDLTPKLRRLAGKLYEIPEPLMAEFQAQFSERDLRVLIAYFERGSELADVRQARLASKIHKSGLRGGAHNGALLAFEASTDSQILGDRRSRSGAQEPPRYEQLRVATWLDAVERRVGRSAHAGPRVAARFDGARCLSARTPGATGLQ